MLFLHGTRQRGLASVDQARISKGSANRQTRLVCTGASHAWRERLQGCDPWWGDERALELEPSWFALCLAEALPHGKSSRGSRRSVPAKIVAIGQALIAIGDTPRCCDRRALTKQASR